MAKRVNCWQLLIISIGLWLAACLILDVTSSYASFEQQSYFSIEYISFVTSENIKKAWSWSSSVEVSKSKLLRSTEFTNRCNACAIVYLTTASRYQQLRQSIVLLFKNFNSRFLYPVLVLHDADFTPRHFNESLKRFLLDAEIALIQYSAIEMELPKTFDADLARKNKLIVDDWRFPGYHLMIGFWAHTAFSNKLIASLEYFWRLDTDSFIYSEIKEDIFWNLKNASIRYAYAVEYFDPPRYVDGFREFVADYVGKNKVQPKQTLSFLSESSEKATATSSLDKTQQNMPIVYNNFEIVHVPTYQRRDIAEFRKAIYSTNNIFLKRWGDAAQRYVTMRLFLDKTEVFKFCNIKYHHQRLWRPTC